MWDVKCGCNPVNEPFEFKICDATYINPSRIELPYGNDSDLCALRNKILSDYCDILNKLECGIQLDLELILEKISIMEMNNNCSFNSLKQIYQSNDNQSECLGDEYIIELIDKSHRELSNDLNQKIGYVYKDVDNKKYLGFASEYDYNTYSISESPNSELILATWDINDSGIGYVLYDRENNRYIAFKNVESYNEYIRDTSKEELIIAQWQAPSNSNKIGYVIYDNNTLYFYSSQESYNNRESPLFNVPINGNILDIIETINGNISSIENSIGRDNLQGTIKGRIAALEENLSGLDNTYATDAALSAAQNDLNGKINAINTFLGSLVQISNYNVPDNTRMVESYRKITINSPDNSSNKELIIKVWNPENIRQFRVGFYDGNNSIETRNYQEGSTIENWPTIQKTDYRLIGWKTGTNIYNSSSSYTVNEDVDFYAEWIEQCTVTFNTNGGNFTAQQNLSITVDKGATIPLPANITKTGFTFNGWHLNNSTGTRVNDNYTVLSSVTLYAGWDEEINYQYALYNGEPENFDGRFTPSRKQTITFGEIENWEVWYTQSPQYIVLPVKNGKTNAEDYIQIKDATEAKNSLLISGRFEKEQILNGNLFIKYMGRTRFGGDSNSGATITFLM